MNSVVCLSQWTDAEGEDALEVIPKCPQDYGIERHSRECDPDQRHLSDAEVLGEQYRLKDDQYKWDDVGIGRCLEDLGVIGYDLHRITHGEPHREIPCDGDRPHAHIRCGAGSPCVTR